MEDFKLSTSFILGYHGCFKTAAKSILAGNAFKPSENSYDWLGHGMYFWEANPLRAVSYMKEVCKRKGKTDRDIAVVGAVIDLGYCLDLLSEASTSLVKEAHSAFSKVVRKAGTEMPKNAGGGDRLFRKLDCAVLNYLHLSREEEGLKSFDSVRGLFIEGKRIYRNAGFYEKTHIQICVRNHSNIKGVFRVSI